MFDQPGSSDVWGVIRSVSARRDGYDELWPLLERSSVEIEDVGRSLWDTSPWDTSDAQLNLHSSLRLHIKHQGEHPHPRLVRLMDTMNKVLDERYERCHQIARRTGKLQQVFFRNGTRPLGSMLVFNEAITPERFDLIWTETKDSAYDLYPFTSATAVGESGHPIELSYASMSNRVPRWGFRLCLEAMTPPGMIGSEVNEAHLYDLLLCDLGLSHEDIYLQETAPWEFEPWRLLRQDDNGRIFTVAGYGSRSAALLALRDIEQNHFRQSYWIETCSD